jgi:hypothetical protein
MPPYLRKFRGWDWFTPAEVRHLPVSEQQRLIKPAHRAAIKDKYLLGLILLVLGGLFAAGWLRDPDLSDSSHQLSLALSGLAVLVGVLIPFRYRAVLRRALRTQMLAEGIRPAVCFQCRYFTEGFEGAECPVCGAVLYQNGKPSS